MAALAQRKLSSRELLDSYVRRIERYNPPLNAVVTLDVERALALLQEVKASHARKLEMYEGFERELKAQFREGAISREAYLGTLLTIRRGIGSEKSYMEWCDEAAQVTASVAPAHSTSEHERSQR